MKYPPYPRYKPSGVAWLGDVPEHWEVKRLKQTARRSDRKVEADPESARPYLGLENVESLTGKMLSPGEDGPQPEGISNEFSEASVLFGKLRPYLAKVAMPSFRGICSSEFLVLEPEGLDRRFLLYLLLSEGFISLVDSSTYGAKMPRASWEFIGSCPVVVPPAFDQLAIATFLDAQTAKLDALIDKKRALIDKLQEKRTALISRTVTRGLPPDAARAAGLDPNPRLKPSGVEWLGDVPERWGILSFKRLCTRVDVGIAEAATHAYSDDGVPIIRSTNVRPDHLDAGDVLRIEPWFAERNSSKYLRAGDLVTVRTGYPGTTAVIPEAFDGAQCFTLIVSSPRSTESPHYFCYLFNSIPGRTYFELHGWGTAQINISVPIVQEMPVPRPPLIEQCAIVDYLNRKACELDKMLQRIGAAIEHLREYRSALITAAVTGKIDVRQAVA